MKRWIIIAIVGAGIVTSAVAMYKANASNSSQKTGTPDLAIIERGAISEEVSASGAVESNLDVEIKCKASGEIVELPYDISDPVTKGDLLVELDPIDEERSVRLAEVQLQSSEARLAQAKQNLLIAEETLANRRREVAASAKSAEANAADKKEKAERMMELLDKKYACVEETQTAQVEAVQAEASLDMARVSITGLEVDRKELEILRHDITLAEVQVEADRIALQNAQQRLKETKVYAPMPGVISDRMVQAGQIISSPINNVSGGTALMTLSDLSRMFVLASVDESDIGKIAVGQPALVTVDAFPDRHFQGEVVRVATKGTLVSNVVTFDVKVEVRDDRKDILRPEMTADVVILCAKRDNALLLPSEAIRGVGEETYLLLPAAPGEEPKRVPVKTGINDGTNVEILSPIDEGAPVLLPEDELDNDWTGETKSSGPQGPGGLPPGIMPPPR